MIEQTRHMLSGIEVDDERLALDVMKAVGIGGDFLAEMHTARHCRTEMYLPKYSNTMTHDAWVSHGSRDLIERIDDDLQNILETHRTEPLPPATKEKITAILKERGASAN